MGKGGTQTTTENSTSTKTPPPYVVDAQKNLLNGANDVTSPFIQQPAYLTAGINPDQSTAYDLTRYMAQDAFTNPQTPAAIQAATIQPTMANVALRGPVATTNAATAGTTLANAQQVTGDEIQKFLNPYTQSVIDPAVAGMRRELGSTMANIGAREAASGAFGGSRGAIERAQANRAFGDQVASTVGTLMAAGYDKATATALANTQLRQNTELTNAGAQNATSQFNAGQTNQVELANAAARNAADTYNATARNAAEAAYAQQATDAARFNVEFGRQGEQANIDNALRGATTNQARQAQLVAALSAIGNEQRGIVGQNIMAPEQMLQLLGSLTPADYGGTTQTNGTKTSPNNSPSPIGQALGAVGSIVGKCDRRAKTDIEPAGVDEATGVPIYAFRYRSDPKTYPKLVAPMAQDLLERWPQAVMEVSGMLSVLGHKLPPSLAVYFPSRQMEAA